MKLDVELARELAYGGPGEVYEAFKAVTGGEIGE